MGRPTFRPPPQTKELGRLPEPTIVVEDPRFYMDKVVDLKDINGQLLMRGSRQQCLAYVRQRAGI